MVISAVSFISLRRNAPLMNDHSDHSHATHRDLSIRSRKTKPRPNIFTFYEPLTQDVGGIQGTGMSVKDDNLLLLTWQREWRKAGWNPIILTLADAQNNVRYEEVMRTLENLPFPGDSGKQYNIFCFLRWLAMAYAGGGWMADMDTFPLNDFRADGFLLPNDGKLTVWDNVVPSLVSGSQMEYQRTALSMVKNLQLHLSDVFYSDMKALSSMSLGVDTRDLFVVRRDVLWGELALNGKDKETVSLWDKWTLEDCMILSRQRRAVHFAHRTMRLNERGAKDRAQIATDWLIMWRESCPQQVINTQAMSTVSVVS